MKGSVRREGNMGGKKMEKSVLFVCYGNACRSIMAEALARDRFDGWARIASAGIAALGRIPPNTLEVLEEVNVSREGLTSKDLDQIDVSRFDVIVNLLDIPIERFIPRRFKGRIINRHVRDPYGGDLDAYRQARDAIDRIILAEFPRWLSGPWT